MKNLLIVITILLLLNGCYTRKQAVRKFCNERSYVHDSVVYTYKDSTVRKLVIKDSTIIHPGSMQVFDLDNLCDSLGRLRNFTIKSKSGSGTVSIVASGGGLHVSAGCDSVVQRLRQELDSVSSMKTTHNIELHDVVKYVEYPEVKWWEVVPRWFWLYVLIASANLFWTILKKAWPVISKLHL